MNCLNTPVFDMFDCLAAVPACTLYSSRVVFGTCLHMTFLYKPSSQPTNQLINQINESTTNKTNITYLCGISIRESLVKLKTFKAHDRLSASFICIPDARCHAGHDSNPFRMSTTKLPIYQSTNQPINQAIKQSINQTSTNQPTNQSTNESITKQSISQSVTQSIN